MEYRNLGSSGLKVSAIGLGTNQFGGKVDKKLTNQIISAAIDHGVNLIDTANVYREGRSEEFIGAALNDRRHQVVIATKLFYKTGEGPNDRGLSRKHIYDAVEASLKRLDTDYIDLYQMHRWDPETPIEETLRAFDDLISQGKIRYIGSSVFAGWQIAHTQWTAKTNDLNRLVSEQPHFHMLHRNVKDEILPAAEKFGVGILPYFPLAGGFLTGKYKPGQDAPVGSRGESSPYVQEYMTDETYVILESLTNFAEERHHPIGELAHAWLLAHPQVSSVISGATQVAHIEANVKGADWTLTAEEFEQINQLLEGESS